MEFKDLGFIGIYRECFKNIFLWKKTFFLIALTLILPLSAVKLGHSKALELVFTKIIKNDDFDAYDQEDGRHGDAKFVTGEYGWVAMWLPRVLYFTIYLVLSLFPTSAVVKTIFAIYLNKDATFIKAVSSVPRNLKRLLVTFLWSLPIYTVFTMVFFGVIFVWFKHIKIETAEIVLVVIFMALYVGTLIYMLMIWQLANVVTILEDVRGRKALLKSEALMKGKKGTYLGSLLVILVLLGGVQLVFEFFVVIDVINNLFGITQTRERIALGLICLVLVTMLELLRLVNQTVVYFICKSKHQEDIDLGPYHLSLKELNV